MDNLTNNFFTKASPTYGSTLSSSISANAETVPVLNTGSFVDGDIVVLTVSPGESNQATFVGEKSGNSFINCVWTEGNTEESHPSGAAVIDFNSATHHNALSKAMQVSHNQDGTLKPNSWNNTAAFQVSVSAMSSVTASTFTKVNFDSVTHDTGNNFDADTKEFVVPVKGLYLFQASVGNTASTERRLIIQFSINGGESTGWRVFDVNSTSGSETRIGNGTIILGLNAGQRVSVLIWDSSGSGYSSISRFGGYLVTRT